jgi:uncharacterized protein YbjQ (UPF0145 family)
MSFMLQDPPPATRAARTGMMRSWGSGTRQSALATDEFAAIGSAGFLTVGRVTGAAGYAHPITKDRCPGTWSSPPVSARGYGTAQTDVSSVGGSPDGTLAAVVRAMDQVRREAIDRMAAQCAALSGQGVVGVRLTSSVTSSDTSEYLECTAIGTAVRAPGAPSLDRPFTADLNGQDFARLIMKGWVPVGLVLGLAIGVRHEDMSPSQDAPTTEIGGITHLIGVTRDDARRKLSQEVRRVGGDGVAVTSVDLAVRERECPKSGGHDRIAQATVAGTAITRFALRVRPAGQSALTIMPLGDRRPGAAPSNKHEQTLADSGRDSARTT